MKKAIVLLWITIFALTACSGTSSTAAGSQMVVQSTGAVKTALPTSVKTTAATRVQKTDTPNVDTSSQNTASIKLNGSSIAVEGTGAEAKGSTLTITSAGTYTITGTLSNGQIVIDAGDEDDVRLVLDGARISNESTSPIYAIHADKFVIQLAEKSNNAVSDGASYTFVDSTTDEPNAAIFSKTDLTIEGSGSLAVTGNYNDGIASKDDLNIKGGTITVSAADDGMRGKDSIEIKGGSLTIKASGDGLKADNADDAGEGFVTIAAGQVTINAGGNAIQAETTVTILDGILALTSGGGSSVRLNSDTSTKGISAGVSVVIEGGTFTIDAADDAINTNGSIVINNGTFNLSTGDDGIHANTSLEVNGGEFKITKSFEGIESAVITINGGDFRIISSDDGVNVAGGVDGSGMAPGGRPGQRQDRFTATGNDFLYINGGYIYVEAVGDGIDVNGAIEMNGGTVVVNGPVQNMNGALDYDRGFVMNGGWLVAVGSSGMAQAPGTSSMIYSVMVNLTAVQKAGTLFNLQNSQGQSLVTFASTKPYQSVVFASPDLVKGGTYTINTGGSASGTQVDGLYQNGSYSGGSKLTSFTVSSVVTTIGTASRMR